MWPFSYFNTSVYVDSFISTLRMKDFEFVRSRLQGEGTLTDKQGILWTGEFHGKAALGLKMQHTI